MCNNLAFCLAIVSYLNKVCIKCEIVLIKSKLKYRCKYVIN